MTRLAASLDGIHAGSVSFRPMPPVVRRLALFSALIAACCLWPDAAWAQSSQLNRCAGPGGGTIYTDRRCDTIGARERLPRSTIAASPGLRRGGCARNLRDLVYEITAAIDNRDVNRLGAVYHWIGHDAQSGDRILDRLQTIAEQPLIDISALRASAAPPITPSPPPADATTTSAPSTSAPSTSAPSTPAAPIGAAPTASIPPPESTYRRPVVGLRLHQTLGKRGSPMQTALGLRRHIGCWWITF